MPAESRMPMPKAMIIEVRCPDCDGRGFTRRGPLEDGRGTCAFCDRCDGRGEFPYHVDA